MDAGPVELRLFFDSRPSDRELNALRIAVLATVQALVDEYLWEGDPFTLRPAYHGERCLAGHMDYGENVEDMWTAVRLLIHVTRVFKGATAQVIDPEGDPLLVEAALHLPEWVSPVNTQNRVFIRGGRVHLIPPSVLTPYADDVPQLRLEEALARLRDRCGDDTVAAAGLQEAIRARAEADAGAPAIAPHRVQCLVPVGVAVALERDPGLVAPAVRAFYTRDATELLLCARMRAFPPEPARRVSVRFTRCLYAQLRQQRFHPPKPFRALAKACGPADTTALDVGAKLACGFEILRHRQCRAGGERKGGDEGAGGTRGADADVDVDVDVDVDDVSRLLHQLSSVGDHERACLTRNAGRLCGLLCRRGAPAQREGRLTVWEAAQLPLGWRLSAAIAARGCGEEGESDCATALPPDDDEAWLRVDEAELEDELTRRLALESGDLGFGSAVDTSAAAHPEVAALLEEARESKKLLAGVGGMLRGSSGLEGVELPVARAENAELEAYFGAAAEAAHAVVAAAHDQSCASGAQSDGDARGVDVDVKALVGLLRGRGSADSKGAVVAGAVNSEAETAVASFVLADDAEADTGEGRDGGSVGPDSDDADDADDSDDAREADSDDEEGDGVFAGSSHGDSTILAAMAAMDAQLRGTAVGSSLDGEAASTEALDLDANLVQSLLAAYSGEAGGTGPASSLMRAMGVRPSRLRQ